MRYSKITHVIFEYRTYIPYVFFVIAAAALLFALRSRPVAIGLLAVVTLLFSGLAFQRNFEINTDEKWYLDMVKYYQKGETLNYTTLKTLVENRKPDKALVLIQSFENAQPDLLTYPALRTLILTFQNH